MFKEKTLLVVGAGASHEFGLPIGTKLSDIIRDKSLFRFDHGTLLQGDRYLLHHIRKKYEDSSERNLRLKALSEIYHGIFLANSIDNFIDSRDDNPQIAEVGKLAIATTIAQAEANSALMRTQGSLSKLDLSDTKVCNTWIDRFARILFERTRRSNIKSIAENVSIICFNYDRCIEQYLTEAISQRFSVPYNDAHDIVANINIIHPYGSLGTLPNTQDMTDEYVAFGFDLESGLNPWPVSERIKTYTEQINDSEIITKIHTAVNEAKQIMFLGFAFHPQNMALLKTPEPTAAKQVYATAMGISKQEHYEVTSRIVALFSKHSAVEDGFRRSLIHLEDGTSCKELFEVHGRNVSAS